LFAAVFAARTLWFLFQSVTNVPYTDEWVMLDEIRARAGWSYLWAPYWGQRIIVPRLLFLLDVKLFSFAGLPLILVNLASAAALWAVLARTARTVLCAVVFASLVFSSLGMEVLAIPQNVQHSLGFAAALSAMLLFERRPRVAAALAAIATGCLAIGLMVWPALIAQAKSARVRWVVTAAAGVVFVLYLAGYAHPAMGLGIGGALRHPLEGLRITGLILGGPVTLYSMALGTVAGLIGLALAGWFAVRSREPLTFAALYLVVWAASLAVGRISPEWLAGLHGAQPLPSRYIFPALIFWGCLFALAFRGRALVPRFAAAGIVIVMTIGTAGWQWRVAREWAGAMERVDAIGAAFIVGVDDPQLMPQLVADEALRTRVAEYMKRERLGMFFEPRAAWMGEHVAGVRACRATLSAVALPGAGAFRVGGAIDPGCGRDALLIDSSGTVVGLARRLRAEGKNGALGYTRSQDFKISATRAADGT
jgi:hypothetical protein